MHSFELLVSSGTIEAFQNRVDQIKIGEKNDDQLSKT